MRFNRFEDIVAWQKAKVLTVQIYQVTAPLKDFGFKDQIQRACVSIMNNIAEGFERKSQKEFIYFLYIAKGSCGEARSMLILAQELNYLTIHEAQKLKGLSEEISKMLAGLIKHLN